MSHRRARWFTFAFLVVLATTACDQQQMPSNVGGDGIDRSAAQIALGSIEGSACSDAAGPRGPVHFIVVFATDGNVVEARFDRGAGDVTTAIAGTPRGNCMLERFRALHVPSFKGAATKVGRKLTLE